MHVWTKAKDHFWNPKRVCFVSNQPQALSKSLYPSSTRKTGLSSLEENTPNNEGVPPTCVGRCLQTTWTPEFQGDWVYSVVSRGYKLEFCCFHVIHVMHSRVSLNPQKELFFAALKTLFLMGHCSFAGRGGVSQLLFQPVQFPRQTEMSDLSGPQRSLKVQKLRMESTQSVITLLHKGDCLAFVDINDASLYVAILQPYQQFLHLAVITIINSWCCLLACPRHQEGLPRCWLWFWG